ncbi:MAG: hypothetical protein ACP5PN_07835, partial [Steroidobacteraceae bacterium]
MTNITPARALHVRDCAVVLRAQYFPGARLREPPARRDSNAGAADTPTVIFRKGHPTVTEPTPATPAPIDCTIAFTDIEALRTFAERCGAQGAAVPMSLACADLPGAGRLAQLRFGNEFCQRLLPSRTALRQGLQLAARCGFGFALALPIVTDAGIDRAERLLGELPDGAEVAVNDWGLMRRMARGFAHLQIIAGRQLCRLLKDPRAPPPMGSGQPRSWANPGMAALLQRLRARRVELDIPPFADTLECAIPGIRLSAHTPFGFVTTGRICRLGNLRQEPARRFATGHCCTQHQRMPAQTTCAAS